MFDETRATDLDNTACRQCHVALQGIRWTFFDGFGPFCPDCLRQGVRLGSRAKALRLETEEDSR